MWRQRFNEAQGKMARDDATIMELRASMDAASQQLASRDNEVAEYHILQSSMVKELGTLSSRCACLTFVN